LIVIGVTGDRGTDLCGDDEPGKLREVGDKLDGGDAGSAQVGQESLACDYLSELGYEGGAALERDARLPCCVEQLARRAAPQQPRDDRVRVKDDPRQGVPRARRARPPISPG